MADRDLRIEVHYEDHGAQQAVTKLDSSLEGVGTTAQQTAKGGLSQMSGLMKGALVGAAVSAAYAATEFVGDLIQMSEETVRVADRTGLTTKAVQQLGYVATQSGNDINQITTAIGHMQNRLASGDKSAVAAVEELGLSTQQLLDMNADEAFYAIGESIAGIGSSADRVRLSKAIFGKAGEAILPTIIADLEKLSAEAPVMADETVRALESAGDTLDWLGLKAKVAGAHLLNFFVDVAKNASQWNFIEHVKTAFGDIETVELRYSASMQRARDATFGALDAMVPLGERGAKPLTMALEDADRISKQLTKSVPKLGKVSGETAAEVWSLAEALKALRINADAAGPELREIDGQLVGIGQSAKSALPWLGWAGQTETGLLPSTDVFAGTILGLGGITDALNTTGTSAETSSKTMSTGLSQAIGVVDALSRVAEMSGHKTTAALLSAASATAQAFATGGPWAAAITGATALLSTFADKLFKTEGRKVNDLRDDFVAAAGGIRELDLKAHEAGLTLDRLLRAKTVKDYEAAVKELTTAFDVQAEKLEHIAHLHDEIASTEAEMATLQASLVPTWEQVSRVMEKYGISLDGAGQKVQQLRMTDWATELLNDWELLQRAGVDTGTILDKMGSKLVDFVRDSIKYGTEIPENMRPVVETLFAQGKLVDANGTKLGSLAGVKFGKPVETEADKINKALQGLVKKLDALVLALQGLVAPSKDAAEQVAHHWATEPWAHWRDPEFPTSDDPHGGSVPERPPFVHTGGYIDPRGRVLHYTMGGEVPALLHSGEYVVRRQAVDALGVGTLQTLNRTGRVPSGSAPITVTINNPEIDSTVGLDRFTRRLELALDRAARRARA